jgi:hypothetical protein
MMRWGLVPFLDTVGEFPASLRKFPQTPFCGNYETNWDCRWQDYFRLADYTGVNGFKRHDGLDETRHSI